MKLSQDPSLKVRTLLYIGIIESHEKLQIFPEFLEFNLALNFG